MNSTGHRWQASSRPAFYGVTLRMISQTQVRPRLLTSVLRLCSFAP